MERNYEQDAAKQGWKPKEDFVAGGGDETAWVDAKVFVERGESSAPILKSKLERSERKLEQMSATVESLTKHHNRMLEKEAADRARLMNELEDARAKAVADGNANAFKQADKKLEQLKQQEALEPVKPANSGLDPVVEQWLEDNPWYNEDEDLQALADGYAGKLRTRNPNLAGRPLLDKVAEQVKAHVERNKPKAPKEPVVDDEGDRTPPPKVERPKTNGKKTFADLPREAQRECERLTKQISGFTKEQYLAYYDWE